MNIDRNINYGIQNINITNNNEPKKNKFNLNIIEYEFLLVLLFYVLSIVSLLLFVANTTAELCNDLLLANNRIIPFTRFTIIPFLISSTISIIKKVKYNNFGNVVMLFISIPSIIYLLHSNDASYYFVCISYIIAAILHLLLGIFKYSNEIRNFKKS